MIQAKGKQQKRQKEALLFSYYGCKSRIARFYPAPVFPILIEPFAGSARYALEHFDREVWLYDVNPKIVEVWRFLIQASVADILSLPLLTAGDYVPTSLSLAEQWLIGFCIGRGDHSPRQKAAPWIEETRPGHTPCNLWEKDKQRIAAGLYKIRHWHIEEAQYQQLPNGKATWFIDPPYQKAGKRYDYCSIDYEHLASWCKEREGQTIVCEMDGADWLPFESFREQSAAARHKTLTKELIWTNP